MKIWRTSMKDTPEAPEHNRRRHGRLKTEGTESSLGSVVDISASGMRIHRKGAIPVQEGEKFRIDVQIDKEIMAIDVIVRRIRKLGRRKFEFGIEFINMSDEDRMRLTRLARIAATSARAMW
ncbi:MAG: PilZ domain-containing protein [Planctomycetota bacterium]